MVEFILNGNLIEETEVNAFEEEISSKIPNEYRTFLLKYNSCEPVPNTFQFILESGDKDESMVDYFYGLNMGRKNSFRDLNENFKIFKNRIPQNYLSIGSDPGGNQIIINLKEGSIFFWDHELEVDEGQLATMDNIYFISSSFNLFVNSLYEFEMPDKD